MKTIYLITILGVLELVFKSSLESTTALFIMYGVYRGIKWSFKKIDEA